MPDQKYNSISDHKTCAKKSKMDNEKSTTKTMRSTAEEQESINEKITWRGSPLFTFARLLPMNCNLPPVSLTPTHEVYLKLPLSGNSILKPHPDKYCDIWDSAYVRMPNSPESLYPIKVSNGKGKIIKRWTVITQAFEKEILSIGSLFRAVISYNSRYEDKWRFLGLEKLVEKEFLEEEREYFFKTLLPKIIKLALDLPFIVTRPLILLKKRSTRSISLSQKQIACLLANAFLCTFPRRNARGAQTEYANYPDINFNRLFFHQDKSALEKMKCIIHYFKQITTRELDGVVTFSRQFVSEGDMPVFQSLSDPIKRLHIESQGLIERAEGFLQVDFANKFIGGGVLGLGCVQEEIRFVLCPELLVSRLFTEVLDRHEALIVTGVEQFSEYKGYSSSFEWTAPYADLTPRDSFKRRLCQVVALDALHFSSNPSNQYRPSQVMRELQKAYVGFKPLENSGGEPVAVATGNWGCGAFKGDPRLKGLIQIAAASSAGRDLAYFTFGDKKLRDDLADVHQYLKDQGVTVGQLVMALGHFGSNRNMSKDDLLEYIYSTFSNLDSDSDPENDNTPVTCDPTKETHPNNSHSILGKTSSAEETKANPSSESKNARKAITDYFKPVSKNGSSRNVISSSDEKNSEIPSFDEGKLLEALNECNTLVRENKLPNDVCGNLETEVTISAPDRSGRSKDEDSTKKACDKVGSKPPKEYSIVNIEPGTSCPENSASLFDALDSIDRTLK